MTFISSLASASSGLALLQAVAQSVQNQNSGGARADSPQADKAASTVTGALPTTGVNDPTKAIEAILAQARSVQVQTGNTSGGSASVTIAAAAYASQTDDASYLTSSSITISSGDISNIDPVSGHSASLLVATANGALSVTTGNQNSDVMALRTSGAINWYQAVSTVLVPYLQAASSQSVPSTNDSSTSATAETSKATGSTPAGQSVVVLNIDMMLYEDASYEAPLEKQAQQLVSALENNTLSSGSSKATGFSLDETYGGANEVGITATEVSDFGSAPIPGFTPGHQAAPEGFQDLIDQSTQYSACIEGQGSYFTFIIPLSGSS